MTAFKKIFTLLCALFMAIGIGVAPLEAKAEDSGGSLTINNASVGSYYKLYKLFEPAWGNTDGSGYIADYYQMNYFNTYIPDAFNFTPYGYSFDSIYNQSYLVTTSLDASALHEKINESMSWRNTDFRNAFSFVSLDSDSRIGMDEYYRATDSTVQMKDLDLGYYVLVSIPAGYSMNAKTTYTLITITQDEPDVVIVEKTTAPYSDSFKSIKSIWHAATNETEEDITGTPSVGVGDIIEYALTIYDSEYANGKKVTSYLFTDELGSGLEYVKNESGRIYTISYAGIEDVVGGIENQLYLHSDDFVREYDEYQELMGIKTRLEFEIAKYRNLLEEDQGAHYNNLPTTNAISLDDDLNLDEIITPLSVNDTISTYGQLSGTADAAGSANKIVITYKAVVTDEFANYGNFTNKAQWYYLVEDDDEPHEGGEGEQDLGTYGFNIYKCEANNVEKALEGAVFNVSVWASDGEKTLSFIKQGDDNEGKSVYYFDPSASQNSVTDLVTDTDGDIVILGLPEEIYYISEVQAPEGYARITDEVSVRPGLSARSFKVNTEGYVEDFDGILATGACESSDGKLLSESSDVLPKGMLAGDEEVNTYCLSKVVVSNAKGSYLPGTGGMGTTLFTIAGCALMAGALIFLITNRKMKHQ